MFPTGDEMYVRLRDRELSATAQHPAARWREEWLSQQHGPSLVRGGARLAGRALLQAGRRLLEWSEEPIVLKPNQS